MIHLDTDLRWYDDIDSVIANRVKQSMSFRFCIMDHHAFTRNPIQGFLPSRGRAPVIPMKMGIQARKYFIQNGMPTHWPRLPPAREGRKQKHSRHPREFAPSELHGDPVGKPGAIYCIKSVPDWISGSSPKMTGISHSCFHFFQNIMVVLNQEIMTTITIDIPEHLKTRYKLGSRVSFDDFTQKIFGDDFVSPDISFTPISDLSQNEKDTLEMAKKYDNELLINL